MSRIRYLVPVVFLVLAGCDGSDGADVEFSADFAGLTSITLTLANDGDDVFVRGCDDETPFFRVEEHDPETDEWERVEPLDGSCADFPSGLVLEGGEEHEWTMPFSRAGRFRFAVELLVGVDPITGEGRVLYSNAIIRR